MNLIRTKNISKHESTGLKYLHRSAYVFLVMIGLNLLWDIFAPVQKSAKHIFLGLIITLFFSLFYFVVKNIKRYFIKKKKIKSKFLDSSTFVPFVYLSLFLLFIIIFNFASFLTENNDVSSSQITVSENKNPNVIENRIESDFRNFVFFMNISMCKYSMYPLAAEHPDLMKKYTRENIIYKKWVVTTKLLLISFLCAFLMQVIVINIAEKVIYRITRKKKKHSSHKKNKILTASV